MNKRNLTIKDASIAFVVAFIVSQLMIIFGQLILSAILSFFSFTSYEIEHFFEKPVGYLIIACFQFISFVGVFIYYHKKTNILKECFKQKNSSVTSILFILTGIASMFLLNNFINYYTTFLNLIDIPSSAISYNINSKTSYFISIISLCIFPAIGEELIFRGIVVNSLKTKSKTLAIVLSSIMFSIFHFNLAQLPYPFLFGLVLAIAYLYTNNITVPITMHFFNNFINISIQYFKKSSPFIVSANSLICSILLVLLWIILITTLFVVFNKKEKQEEAIDILDATDNNKQNTKEVKSGSFIQNYKQIFKSEKFWFYFPLLLMLTIYIIINI